MPLQSVTQTTPPRATLPYGVRALPLLRCQSETDGVKREREHLGALERGAHDRNRHAEGPQLAYVFGDDAVAPGGWVRRRAGRSRLPVVGAQAPALAWPLLSDTGSCTVAYGSPSAGALALRERM